MNEPGPGPFCVNCGEPLGADLKFCVGCGAPRPEGASTSLAATRRDLAEPDDPGRDAEPEVASQNAPPPTPPPAPAPSVAPTVIQPTVSPKSPLLDRTQKIVIGVGMVLVIAIATAIVVLAGNDDDGGAGVTVANSPLPAASVPAAVVTVPPAPATVAPTTPATVTGLDSVATQVDTELTESAAQVASLKSVIAKFEPGSDTACALSAADAASQTGDIIERREALAARLAKLADAGDATARRLASLLRSAIDLSIESDVAYKSWMSANGGTDASLPCRRAHEANWNAAQSIAPRAGDAKKAFVAAYNPVASRLGLRADWAYTDI